MIKRILDTNICIYLIKNKSERITDKFAQYRRGEIVISSITWAEICCGIHKDGKYFTDILLTLLEIVPFDKKAAECYATLSISHPNRKVNFDRLIAAHSIALNTPLVTNNIIDFECYKDNGLLLENWT